MSDDPASLHSALCLAWRIENKSKTILSLKTTWEIGSDICWALSSTSMSHKIADESNRQIRERMFCRQIGQIEKWIVAGTKKVIDVSTKIELTFNNLHSKENFEI